MQTITSQSATKRLIPFLGLFVTFIFGCERGKDQKSCSDLSVVLDSLTVQTRKAESPDTREQYTKILSELKRGDCLAGMAFAMHEIASVCLLNGLPDSAMYWDMRALQVLSRMESENQEVDHCLKLDLHMDLFNHWIVRQVDSAKNHLETMKGVNRRLLSKGQDLCERSSMVAYNEGLLFFAKNNRTEAIEKFELAIEQLRMANMNDRICQSFRYLSILAFLEMDTLKYEVYSDSLDAYFQDCNPKSQITIVTDRAKIYDDLGRPKQALRSLNKADTSALDKEDRSSFLYLKGAILANMDSFSAAEKVLLESYSIDDISLERQYNSTMALGGVYMNLKDYQKALEYTALAHKVSKNLGSPYDAASAALQLAETFLALEQDQESLSAANNCTAQLRSDKRFLEKEDLVKLEVKALTIKTLLIKDSSNIIQEKEVLNKRLEKYPDFSDWLDDYVNSELKTYERAVQKG